MTPPLERPKNLFSRFLKAVTRAWFSDAKIALRMQVYRSSSGAIGFNVCIFFLRGGGGMGGWGLWGSQVAQNVVT